MTPFLSARDVSVDIDGRAVLRHVDLEVCDGELVVLLGANGSGKSTLVRAVTGLLPVRAGRIELFGTDLSRFRDHHRLGFVPQRTQVTSGVPATVREVVASGRLTHRPFIGWSRAADRRAVDEAIERVDLTALAQRPVAHLSGGQQQRVMIARALAGQADLLVMDEPVAGVDHSHQDALAAVLTTLVHDGTSVLLVAHELGPLRPLISRAVCLREGHVIYDGPVDGIPRDQTEPAHHHHEPEPPVEQEGVWP